MSKILYLCVNAVYLPFLLLLSGLFTLLLAPSLFLYFVLGRKGGADDAARVFNWLYGRFLLISFWPWVTIRKTGLENAPKTTPYLAVFNHRSYTDVMLSSHLPCPNMVVAVRSWPFRMFVLNWFMRLAGYLDVETLPLDQVIEQTGKQAALGATFLFFPEGHRSRDGRLQRFRSCAFRVAAAHNLPIVPVCLTGSENMARRGMFFLIFPAKVQFEFLPMVYPSDFPEEKRALRLRRKVERMFLEHLGESDADLDDESSELDENICDEKEINEIAAGG